MTHLDRPLTADTEHRDGRVILRLAGELDHHTVPVLARAIANLVGPDLKAVTVDLTNVRFVDLLGLRGLVDARRTVNAASGDFRLSSIGEMPRRAIRLSGLEELTDIATGVEP